MHIHRWAVRMFYYGFEFSYNIKDMSIDILSTTLWYTFTVRELENGHRNRGIYCGFTHSKWWFSIFVLYVYQRVNQYHSFVYQFRVFIHGAIKSSGKQEHINIDMLKVQPAQLLGVPSPGRLPWCHPRNAYHNLSYHVGPPNVMSTLGFNPQ